MSRAWRLWAIVLACGAVALGQDVTPTITLAVKAQPPAEVLRQIAEQGGIKLEITGDLPATPLSLELRGATVEGALQQVTARLGYRYELVDGVAKLSPMPDTPPPTPDVEGLPKRLLITGRALLYAVYRRPDDAQALADLGSWLAAQRPDWREVFGRNLPEMWMAWDERPVQLLRGGQVFQAVGELDAARRILPMARRDDSLEVPARCLLAEVELQRGNPSRALAESTMALRRDPSSARATAVSAEANLYIGRQQEALAEAMSAEARWPDSAEVHATLGNILRRDDEASGAAARSLQRALDLRPELPGALFGLAVLAARENQGARSRWLEFLHAEPFSMRANRIRLGVTSLGSVGLTERGGPVWDVSSDGERVLYMMKFRKQLEITDSRGSGLANQVTDQDTEKVGASFSPDEQWLAWIVPAGDKQRLYLQGINASGHEREIATSDRGATLRRTTWSPDGRYLLFSEHLDTGGTRQVKLRAWDMETQSETAPPSPVDKIDGLGDIDWLPDGRVIGTLVRDNQLAVVEVAPDGTLALLRPPARLRSYAGPSLDPSGTRLIYQTGELVCARPDGSEGGATAVLTGVSTSETGLWAGHGERLVVAVNDNDPTAITVGGLDARFRLKCRPDPWPTAATAAPTYTFAITNLAERPTKGTMTATIVDELGEDRWHEATPLDLKVGGTATVTFKPEAASVPGWMRLEIMLDDVAETPRWYRFGPLER